MELSLRATGASRSGAKVDLEGIDLDSMLDVMLRTAGSIVDVGRGGLVVVEKVRCGGRVGRNRSVRAEQKVCMWAVHDDVAQL